jgi:DNA-binding beta-propeller fold protein YncE
MHSIHNQYFFTFLISTTIVYRQGCIDPDGAAGPLELGDEQFNYPSGIAINSTGYVYVTENNNERIQVFRRS